MPSRTILFLSKGFDKPSTRYRAAAYFPSLQQAGWEPIHLTVGRSRSEKIAALRAAEKATVVVVLRRLFSPWFLRSLCRASRHLIFDFDDAVFVRDDGRPSHQRLHRFRGMVRRADCIWAGNRYLADAARRWTNSVEIIPTAIDLQNYYEPHQETVDQIDLVWIGSHSTAKYLVNILPAIEEANRLGPSLRLKVIADFPLTSAHLEIIAIPWSKQTEVRELACSSIGIAPLHEDSWTKGKCGLKVLQYMAVGLAVIASDVGVHRDMIDSGVTGMLVNDPLSWAETISELAKDRPQQQSLGHAGRDLVTREYSLENIFDKLLESLNRLIN